MSAALDATRPESPAPSGASAKRLSRRGNGKPLVRAITYQDDSPASWLAFIGRAMADPATDVAKLEILVRMRREILADEARHAFNTAMSAAQSEMAPVIRDADNRETHSQYARLETIDEALRPIYTRHGFCLSFNSEPIDGPNQRIVCEVSHVGRHSKFYALEAAWDTVGPKGTVNKTPVHGMASAVSYLRRYLICMIFHVVLKNQDLDGNQPKAAKPLPAKVDELHALLAECSADPAAVADNERRFLDRMGLGNVRTLAEAPPADFARLRNALLAKRERLAKAREWAQ